jgi:hypothetical protein
LKPEIRLPVASQVTLLAHVQEDLQSQSKEWTGKQYAHSKVESSIHRQEASQPTVKLASGTLWKDRHLRDYRRANGLCFHFGEKYDPTHQCTKKAELNVVAVEQSQTNITSEVLELLELQDITNAQDGCRVIAPFAFVC